MSLNRQRILSELGSVMNQLQSADCGCMGKLFSDNRGNQGTMGTISSPVSTCGSCRHSCCHGHGYNQNSSYSGSPCVPFSNETYSGSPHAGEPYSMNHRGNMNMPCMGKCNPPKLYADTYNYLNSNLMQPVVQEVYNDLKSISPANTVGNNPLANQLGLGGNVGNPQPSLEAPQGNQMKNMPGMMSASPMSSTPMDQSKTMDAMGGMGPGIVKMMMSDKNSKPSNQGQAGQFTGPMVIDAPNSPHGMVGVTPLTTPELNQTQGYQNMNQMQYNANAGQPNMNTYSNMNQQNPSNNLANTTHNNTFSGNKSMGNANANLSAQQMSPTKHNSYGQHTQGVMKFNDMFPGVMQGGDLGFDPMAIAIQMNPANHQKAAIGTIHKIMNGNQNTKAMDAAENATALMKPVINSTQLAIANMSQLQSTQNPTSQKEMTDQSYIAQQNLSEGQIMNQQMTPGQQNVYPNTETNPPQVTSIPPQQQQVYTTLTGAQQVPQQNMQTYQASADVNRQLQQEQYQPNMNMTGGNPAQEIIKEPILPVDTSKNYTLHDIKPQNHYNTLGQPVEMYPAKMFHPPEPGLPQTLSPQEPSKLRNDFMKYSNVKSTVSKTSLIGNRPGSRSQLQHLPKQYKGSQSFTQQNVRVPQGATFSDGRLNVPQTNVLPAQVPVEKFGGDTIANNKVINNSPKAGQPVEQVGDVPNANKPQSEGGIVKPPLSPIPVRQAKLRNGLQDVVYTSYPSSAAWSFHGPHEFRASPRGVRYRS